MPTTSTDTHCQKDTYCPHPTVQPALCCWRRTIFANSPNQSFDNMLRIRNMNDKALASIDALYGLMRFVAVPCNYITADHRAQAEFITLTVPSLLKVEISSTDIGKIASV